METPWREVVEKTCLGVWIVDSQDRTVYVNERLSALLGLLPAEMVHRTLPEIIDPPQSVRLLTCLKQNQRALIDFYFQRPDGKHLYLLFATNPMLVHGSFRGTLIMVADITERKLAEELLWRQAHIVDQIHDAVISKLIWKVT
jgi:PAS domain S-box-containing protein